MQKTFPNLVNSVTILGKLASLKNKKKYLQNSIAEIDSKIIILEKKLELAEILEEDGYKGKLLLKHFERLQTTNDHRGISTVVL